MIKAVIFDLDNTLVDFMSMKRQAVTAAITAMIDAGLGLTVPEAEERIDAIYKERGIEFQNVFDQLLYDVFQKVDYKILSAGIIAYRRAREARLCAGVHAAAAAVRCRGQLAPYRPMCGTPQTAAPLGCQPRRR